jgi:hypothetical protein
MELDILDFISRHMEETNFFNDQKKLDTMYYLMQGFTYREIAEKIDKHISYVQRVMDYLRNNGLLSWGRWAPNVYKIGMRKSIAFLDWKDREVPMRDNPDYETYVHHVQAEKTKVCVIYTYPKEDESQVKGERGELITPFYYTHTQFRVPFFKNINLVKEFFDILDSVDNDKKILIGTPSFEEKSCTDPLIIYICRYGELLPELTPGILTDKLEQDFKDYKEVEISYNRVRDTLNRMKEEEVIFPKNALYLKPLSYQSALTKIETKEIFRIMGAFNRFNMLTQLAMTRDPDVFYLFIQYPFHLFSEVMEVLDHLDPTRKTYVSTKFIDSDTICFKWSLERFLKSKSSE